MPKLPSAPDIIQLRYAQLEELVGGLLETHPDKKSALSARFRLFRQRGFPPNVTTLAKTRFGYNLDATLRLVMAFWMMDAFIPQETVPLVIERDWEKLKPAFRDAFQRIQEHGIVETETDDQRQVMLVAPRNLHSFTLQKSDTADPAAAVEIHVLTAKRARERVFGESRRNEFAPVTVIDLHRLAAWVREALLRKSWAVPAAFENFGVD